MGYSPTCGNSGVVANERPTREIDRRRRYTRVYVKRLIKGVRKGGVDIQLTRIRIRSRISAVVPANVHDSEIVDRNGRENPLPIVDIANRDRLRARTGESRGAMHEFHDGG